MYILACVHQWGKSFKKFRYVYTIVFSSMGKVVSKSRYVYICIHQKYVFHQTLRYVYIITRPLILKKVI